MTHLESLNLRYDQLDQELKALESRENRLYYRGENQKKLMLKKSFESFSHDKFQTLVSSVDRVTLSPKNDSYNYLVEYSLDTRWRSDDGDRIERTRLNHNGSYFYNNEDEKNFNQALVESEARVEFMKLAAEKDEQIQADWMAIDEKYSDLRMKFWDKLKDLRSAVNDASRDISKFEEQAEMDKLENKEGISFKSKDGKSLPGLDVRFDWRIGQIKNIRVVGKTASGKSVDLEVVRKWSKWDDNLEKRVDIDKVEVFPKVRFDKVKSLLRNARYNQLIVQ
jgi:hypothetical protein